MFTSLTKEFQAEKLRRIFGRVITYMFTSLTKLTSSLCRRLLHHIDPLFLATFLGLHYGSDI